MPRGYSDSQSLAFSTMSFTRGDKPIKPIFKKRKRLMQYSTVVRQPVTVVNTNRPQEFALSSSVAQRIATLNTVDNVSAPDDQVLVPATQAGADSDEDSCAVTDDQVLVTDTQVVTATQVGAGSDDDASAVMPRL